MQNASDFARLSAIVTSSDDAILSSDFSGKIVTWNNGAAHIFGFTSAELIGQHFSKIIPEQFVDAIISLMDEIKNGSPSKHFESFGRRKDGGDFPVSITMSPIRNVEFQVVGISIIARDISERRKNEYYMSLLASIINSSDDAIVSKNLDGVITSWNPGAEKIFGYAAEEAIGRNISLIIPVSKLDEEASIIKKISRGEKIDHIETIRKCKDGSEINVSVTISPVEDRDGKIIGASKIARDISQRIEREKQKALFTSKLEELNNFKDDFMMMASHELKTPITVIKASLQVLQDSLTKDSGDIMLVDKSLDHVDRLSRLVSELLDVSKIQNGKLDLDIQVFDLTLLLKEILNDLHPVSSNHQVILGQPDALIEIRADRQRIKQVLENIISNAIKFSPQGSIVHIETAVKETGVIVKVKDDGIGIAPEHIDKIFSRFFRVGGIASTFSGTGVGLYISAEILRHHGGKMWVESELNKGSAFYIEIPTLLSANLSNTG